MNETKYININNMPKWFKMFFFILPLACLLLIKFKIDNDFYFLYPTGEYIVKNGFPVKDFLSMHTDMDIIVQQWLSSVIFYFVYSHFGTTGTFALVIILSLLFVCLYEKLCLLITNNNMFVSSIFTLLSCSYLALVYIRTRPQIFTYLIIIIELNLLELYVKKHNVKYLIFIPILSLLQINLHCSMWFMIFIFMAPYFVNAVTIKTKVFSQDKCCNLIPLIITAIVSGAMGLINPYGIKAIIYIFTSYGFDEINSFIAEMGAPTFSDVYGKILFAIIFITVAICIVSKTKQFRSRYVLLYLGTLVLALTSYKSIAYFLLAGIPAFTYCAKDFSFSLKFNNDNRKSSKKMRTVLIICLIVALAGLTYTLIYYNSIDEETEKTVNSSESGTSYYEKLDDAIEILNNTDDDVVLYNGFDLGPYLEFKGYATYIDSRAELYLDCNNNDYNYLKEYADLYDAKIYYKNFIEKYNFNYLLVKESERYLYTSLMNDNDYEILYNTNEESNNIVLFKLKD